MPVRCRSPASPIRSNSSSVGKVTCSEETPAWSQSPTQVESSAVLTASVSAPVGASRRGPVTGVNGTETWSLG